MAATLKPKQRLLAELMALEPELTNAEYALRIGIDQKTLYRWKKEEIFKDYLHEICREKFKDLERLALKKLEEQIMGGDFSAVQYVLNNIGYKAEDALALKTNDITLKINIEE